MSFYSTPEPSDKITTYKGLDEILNKDINIS